MPDSAPKFAAPDVVDVLAALARLEAKIDKAIEAREPGPRVNAATADLLRVIRAAVGDYVFTCADLVEHAALPGKAALSAAIVSAVGSMNPRRIGKALRAVEGIDLDGVIVRRTGSGRDGIEWRVCASLKLANTVA